MCTARWVHSFVCSARHVATLIMTQPRALKTPSSASTAYNAVRYECYRCRQTVTAGDSCAAKMLRVPSKSTHRSGHRREVIRPKRTAFVKPNTVEQFTDGSAVVKSSSDHMLPFGCRVHSAGLIAFLYKVSMKPTQHAECHDARVINPYVVDGDGGAMM